MSPNNPNAPAIYQAQPAAMFTATTSIFDNLDKLAQYEELALRLSKSSLVPAMYRNKPEECFIALEYAANMGIRPLMAMQNLTVVEGKPSWDGKFVGSVITACGRFRSVRYVMGNEGKISVKVNTYAGNVEAREVDNLTCYIEAVEVASGNIVKGTTISVAMAYAEGWLSKKGSKWQTMPEQMIQYRAASFFGRVHVQDILFGMYTADEAAEIASQDAGTGAVEIMDGVAGDAPRGRQRRQAVAAPAVAAPAPVTPPAPGETVVGEYVSSEPVDETSSTPAPEPVAVAQAAPAPAPVAAAPANEPAPVAFVIQPRHIAVLLKIQKEPLAVKLSDEERKAIKEFGTAYPDFVKLPQRMGSKTELVISAEGLEFLATDPAALAAYDSLKTTAEDLGEPSPEESAGMTNEPEAAQPEAAPAPAVEPAPAPTMTAAPGGAASNVPAQTQATINQLKRDETARQQYGTPALPPPPAEDIATPYSDAVPSPFAEVKKPGAAEDFLARKNAELAGKPAETAPAAEAPKDDVSDLFDLPM